MNRLLLLVLLLYSVPVSAQSDFFVLKKKSKSIQSFGVNSYFTFQLKSGQWIHGLITKVQNDSFYLTKEEIRYHFMTAPDTLHFSGFHFALSDVAALPNKGILIDYNNGYTQIDRAGGHVHFYWIRSGWLFRVAGAGYLGLDAANGLLNHSFTFSGSKAGIASAVFLLGVLLHRHGYKPAKPLKRKYHLQYIKIAR
jgi:hypothetical protein